MKNYIALKPCRFQGVNYKIGEKISEEIIGKKAVGGLISMEYISEDGFPIVPLPVFEEKISEEKILPQEISTTEEIKKPKKKSKVGDENDVQLQS